MICYDKRMSKTINSKLTEIDDCLYRVATKAFIIQDNKLLMVKEIPEGWWGFPGGGVDYGEQLEIALARELEEELGVDSRYINAEQGIAHMTIGTVVDSIPRMNIFYKVSIPTDKLAKTDQVSEWQWFTKEEFLELNVSPSYDDKQKFAKVIFG